MAHYGVFRQELAISYPTYGNALWEPDPGGQYDTVEVGDVGFIRRGYFQRLFNILHPKDHPSHRNPSFVPEDHQQLVTIPDHIVKNEIRTGSRQNSLYFCSQHVDLDSRGRGTSAFGPEDDSQLTFSCTDGRQGALLSLPVPAQGEDTVAFGDFGKWMIKHIDAWFAFARGLGLGVNRMEDIILVTGRHLTKSWVNVAFTQRRQNAGVSFDVQVSDHGRISLEQDYVRGGDLKLGPTGRDLPENQCIFIRGFRVVRILGMWPKRLRGQAGPPPNAGDHEPQPESDTHLELLSVPADSDDPLHDLLQYVARQVPDCDMALVHDNDLACIDVAPRAVLQTPEFMEVLRDSAPMIQQFQCDLLSGDKSGPGADVPVTKVAILSGHAFDVSRKGSGLSPISTLDGPTDTGQKTRLETRIVLSTIETEIALLQEKLADVNEMISNLSPMPSLTKEKPTTLRAQSDELSPQHSSNRTFRIEPTNKSNVPLRGILKEDRTIVKRSRANSDPIDADRATTEELKKRVDHPKAKAISDPYFAHALEAEMDVMMKDVLEFSRLQLFRQQITLQRQINMSFSERYDLISWLHEDDKRYHAKLNKDRSQRAERWNVEREAEGSRAPTAGRGLSASRKTFVASEE